MSLTQFNQRIPSLETRLALEALRLKEAAKVLPRGEERMAMIRKASQIETASHINEWLSSPGLQPPR
jgi:uncharacterized coiled-coil protein SlyX